VTGYLYPEQELHRRTLAWALRLKVNPKALHVVDLKDKWGCCSASGEVTFARDLVEMDGGFQDYVIVHELLHLRVPSHGRRFKALMTAYIPEWRRVEAAARDGALPEDYHG
jgi:predicted metal-dependent hydrolase